MDAPLKFHHEDDAIAVVEKPAGIPCLSARAGRDDTLVDRLRAARPGCAFWREHPEAGIAHRLDNDTSGLVAVAKNPVAWEALRAAFGDGFVEKHYLALVLGEPPDEARYDQPIAHHPRKRGKMVVCDSEKRLRDWKGRPAHTAARVLARGRLRTGGRSVPYALLEVAITTGVRHQIRVHLAAAGFPLAGDRLYQHARASADDLLAPERHLLHAHRLALLHPQTVERIAVRSTPPADFGDALEHLGIAFSAER